MKKLFNILFMDMIVTSLHFTYAQGNLAKGQSNNEAVVKNQHKEIDSNLLVLFFFP